MSEDTSYDSQLAMIQNETDLEDFMMYYDIEEKDKPAIRKEWQEAQSQPRERGILKWLFGFYLLKKILSRNQCKHHNRPPWQPGMGYAYKGASAGPQGPQYRPPEDAVARQAPPVGPPGQYPYVPPQAAQYPPPQSPQYPPPPQYSPQSPAYQPPFPPQSPQQLQQQGSPFPQQQVPPFPQSPQGYQPPFPGNYPQSPQQPQQQLYPNQPVQAQGNKPQPFQSAPVYGGCAGGQCGNRPNNNAGNRPNGGSGGQPNAPPARRHGKREKVGKMLEHIFHRPQSYRA